MYFFYDGTYVGFLTTVYEIYHHGTSHLEGILVEGGEVPLFGAQSIVVTRLPDAEKKRCDGCTGLFFPTKKEMK